MVNIKKKNKKRKFKLFHKQKKSLEEIRKQEDAKSVFGSKLSFAAAEAYKLLRTNMNFSIAEDTNCKIFAFTSAMPGEGKTTTVINTGYAIAQTGKKVLIIESDLRLPTIGRKLGIPSKPGLSNVLVDKYTKVIQPSGLHPDLFIMPAGDIPPNPAELLGSERMKEVLGSLADFYDVILIDTPPIGVVTDGLILSKLITGMIVVVREDYADKRAVDDAIRQLRFADTKILGFVYTGAGANEGSKYGKYSKYGRYSKYGEGYYGENKKA